MASNCRVCDSADISREFTAHEMMFGTREAFDYFECDNCGTVQIKEVPESGSIARNYPDNYYSFRQNYFLDDDNRVKKYLKLKRDQYELGFGSVLGFIASLFKPRSVQIKLFRILKIDKNSRVLDIGCGRGVFVDFLASRGFTKLKGIDPFNSKKLVTKRGVEIEKSEVYSVHETFELVMLHHVLEHVSDPVDILIRVKDLLAPNGICIVRVPTSSSSAWEKYGKKWVQLDPPRHLTIPSRRGMKILGQKSGLVLEKIIDDSTEFQFWGSEQYVKDIPLARIGSESGIELPTYPFDASTMRKFAREAKKLNAQGRGDQAAFIYRRTGGTDLREG